jgi:hypothetical protein
MLKFLLPMGLLIGAIATSRVVTPTLFSQSISASEPAQFVNNRQSTSPGTSQEDLEEILGEIATEIDVNQNQILFKVEDQSLLLITDSAVNRMRIILPVAKVEDVSEDEMATMMIANFHTALDGRYAIGNGIVFAAFIHPLSSLQPEDFKSAVLQVSNLGKTYGSTYNSGTNLFGVPINEPSEELPSI